MVARWLWAGLLAALVALNIGVTALSINGAGSPVRLGRSVHIGTDRFRYVSLTPAGAKIGVRIGDVYDTRLLTLSQRMQEWNRIASAHAVVDLPLMRGERIVHVRQPFTFLSPEDTFSDEVFFVFICICALSGLIMFARGRNSTSLAAGIMLVSLSFYHQSFPAWNAPLPVVVGLFLCSVWAVTAFGVSAFVLGLLLLPASVPRFISAMLIVAAALALGASFLIWTFDYTLWHFSGHTIFNGEQIFEWARLAQTLVIAAIFGLAAATVRGKASAAVRILFIATLCGFGGDVFLFITELLGQQLSPPGLIAYTVCWTLLCAGYLYALFGKQLVSLDFVVNRAAVFAVIVALVSAILVLAEKLAEWLTLGSTSSFIVELAVTLGIALSFKRIERHVQNVVEHVFYRDKLRAAEALEALSGDFPFVRDTSTLADHVTREIRRHMRSPHVAMYLAQSQEYRPTAADGEALTVLKTIPDSDALVLRLQARHAPADARDFVTQFPRNTTVFPMVVLGAVIGCIVADERSNGEAFDPDERALLMRVAHETATALSFLKTRPVRSTASAASTL